MSDTPNPTSQAVAEAVAELNIPMPAVLDPIALSLAEAGPKPAGQGEQETAPPAAETKPAAEAKPAEEAPKPPTNPDAPQNEDEAFNLTAEDFEEMEKNPVAKKAYKSMLRGFRAKAAALADKRKAFESDEQIMAQIRTNPRAAIQALASVAGIPVAFAGEQPAAPAAGQPAADPVTSAIDAASKQLDDVLTPDGAKILRPILTNMMKAIAEQAVAPYKAKTETQERIAAEVTLQSTVKSFGAARLADGDEWSPEIEAEMAGLVGKVLPGRGMTINDYIQSLYDQVAAKHIRAAAKTREFERLRAAAGAAEPVRGVRAPGAGTMPAITTSMSHEEAARVAVAQALAEMGAR